MIRVMIVDDEPFIRQGLKILINWEQYGFLVCGEAATGKEALELMEHKEFDLVITDIKMPNMSGIELIEHVREHTSGKIGFIILSGFCEFEYAKKAIKYKVLDYVLKPVQKDELIRVLEIYKEQYDQRLEMEKKLEDSDKIVFDRNLAYLISGKYRREHLEHVKKNLADSAEPRYINIEFDSGDERFRALTPEEKTKAGNLLYDTLVIFLGEHRYHALIEAKPDEDTYRVGFIFVRKLAEEAGLSEKDYIQKLYGRVQEKAACRILLGIGQTVEDISQLSESYRSACYGEHAFSSVLSKIEKEITEHYMDNLSLKSLGEKYYINSAYLGQIFKRQYGYSFKDYLNNFRIERAAELLLRSDEKIYLIAEAVGFNNTDYFINKFAQRKGRTPLQYRKSCIEAGKIYL